MSQSVSKISKTGKKSKTGKDVVSKGNKTDKTNYKSIASNLDRSMDDLSKTFTFTNKLT